MSPTATVRILMYSHDTYGLGHLSRTLRIARAIRARFERASILVLSGSPVAPYVPLPPGADLIKFPSVEKAGDDRYRSRDLEVEFAQIRLMRRELIRSTAETFQPHLVLVDNVPLGMKGELVPALDQLRAASPQAKIVLDLRDVLDAPASIRAAWERDGIDDALLRYYDRIFIFGDPTVFDAIAAYRLPPDRTRHLGYLSPREPRRGSTERNEVRPMENGTNGAGPCEPPPHRILVTAGGGGDGFSFLDETLRGLSLLQRWRGERGDARRIQVEIVTGPLMDADERRVLAAHAGTVGAQVSEFIADLPDRMAAADLVIAMAGYNTCCELLSHARAALLLPRVAPRREQILRAEALAARGIWTVLSPEDASPRSIAEAVEQLLGPNGARIAEGTLPDMGGLARLTEELAELCPELLGADTPPDLEASIVDRPEPAPAARDSSFLMRAVDAIGLPPALVPAFHWPGTAFSALLLTVGAGLCSGATLRPDSFGGSFVVGRDANVLSSSDAEKRAFESNSPNAWFEVDRLDDTQGRLALWSRWKLPSFYKTARVGLDYRRSEYRHAEILGRDRFAFDVKQKLPGESVLDFEASYEPQVYMRHRVDKDAPAGAPRFRPEAYRVLSFGLSHTRPLATELAFTIGFDRELERATRWFRERERARNEGYLRLTTLMTTGLGLRSKYGYAAANSRNRPDLGSDLGYHEHVLGLGLDAETLRWGGPWQVALDATLKLRHYTTGDRSDTSRFDRDDRTHALSARLTWARRAVAPFLLIEGGGRRIDLPPGATADSDESEYDDSFMASGIAWQF
mgnify:CR=1 FL=1